MVKISSAALSAFVLSGLTGGASAFTTLKSQAARQPATLLSAVSVVLFFPKCCFHLEARI
jgi:hypothetical protein